MGKRKRFKKRKVHYSDAEKLLVGLDKIVRSGSENARTASSLAQWYMANKEWTANQWNYVRSLIRNHKRDKKPKSKKFYLYAFSDGSSVKLGYSSRVKTRLSGVRTGSPKPVKCVWQMLAGDSESQAKTAEKRLHKACKKYHLRGEWFHVDCVTLVKQFELKAKAVQERIEADLDMQVLVEKQIL